MEEITIPPPLDRSAKENSPLNLPSLSVSFNGIGNCYVFKSRLQEYAQKVGIPTPVYQTVEEGPSSEPVFRSAVTVNDVNYESLPGFSTRKAAEQSAAEIALTEIQRSGQMTHSIPTVHETGLCKNVLQDYAQKMNYAIPSYKCTERKKGMICTVEIGGIQYIGAASRTKKEAEIKAARTALLSIQHGSQMSGNGDSHYTVLPTKRKERDKELEPEPVEQLKPKKARSRKKWLRWRLRKKKHDKASKSDNVEAGTKIKPDDVQSFNEQGSGGMKDEPQSQSNELKASARDSNGHCQVEKQFELTRFEECQEVEIVDSLLAQEVKGDAAVNNSCVNVKD